MLRLGIIGAGIMGERLARAAAEHATDTVVLAGVWDPSEAALQRFAAAVPGVPTRERDALIAASDCVYVASPPASHLNHARAALAAGRGLFCEKPLAVDVAEAGRFVAEAAGARAGVNFPFASSPGVARLRGWLDEGAIGTPQRLAIDVAFATWPRSWQRDAASWLDAPAQGGFTREVVSHFLFLARRLLGALVLGSHAAEFPEHGHSERRVTASFTAGGLPGTLTGAVGRTALDDHNTWTLTGTEGAIRLHNWSVAEILRDDGVWQPDPEAMPNERLRPLVLTRQLAGVVRMTAGQTHHLATLAEALAVQTMVEGILAG